MIKQLALIIILSLVAIYFKTQLSHLLNFVVSLHHSLESGLHAIFSDDRIGRIIQDTIALLLIPFLIGAIVGLVFWFVKHVTMPHIMAVIWTVWLILLVTMIAQASVTHRATVATTHPVTPGHPLTATHHPIPQRLFY